MISISRLGEGLGGWTVTVWSAMTEGAKMEAAPLSFIRDQNQVHARLPNHSPLRIAASFRIEPS